MSIKAATYAERTVLRLPHGTLDWARREAERKRTNPAEILRRAIAAARERSAPERQGEEEAA